MVTEEKSMVRAVASTMWSAMEVDKLTNIYKEHYQREGDNEKFVAEVVRVLPHRTIASCARVLKELQKTQQVSYYGAFPITKWKEIDAHRADAQTHSMQEWVAAQKNVAMIEEANKATAGSDAKSLARLIALEAESLQMQSAILGTLENTRKHIAGIYRMLAAIVPDTGTRISDIELQAIIDTER